MPERDREFEPHELKKEIFFNVLDDRGREEIEESLVKAIRQLEPLNAIKFAQENRDVLHCSVDVKKPIFNSSGVEVGVLIYRVDRKYYLGMTEEQIAQRAPKQLIITDEKGRLFIDKQQVYRLIPKKELPLTPADLAVIDEAGAQQRWFQEFCDEQKRLIDTIKDAPAVNLKDRLRLEIAHLSAAASYQVEILAECPVEKLLGRVSIGPDPDGEITAEKTQKKLAELKEKVLVLAKEINSWLPPPEKAAVLPRLPASGKLGGPYRS